MQSNSDWFEIIVSIGKFIQTYGAWGVCVLLVAAFVVLYYFISTKHEKQLKDLSGILEKRNNQLLSLIQRCSIIISNSAQAIEESTAVLESAKAIILQESNDRKNLEEVLKKATTILELTLYSKTKN